MKVAVTAANGKLGRAAVCEFVGQFGKENVIGIVRTPEKAKDLGIEIRKGDYNSLDDFKLALQGVDQVLVISGLDAPENRIQQHRNIIKAAEENNVKKLVYTSIIGSPVGTAFDPVIKSNRQTEEDIMDSSLDWAISRNGLYIEPDLEYIQNYIDAGIITNSAANGKCAYTSRTELARAYAAILKNDDLKSEVYNIASTPITQTELAEGLNTAYETSLIYKEMSSEAYLTDRKNELGDFIGTIVSGIYDGISKGSFNVPSDFTRIMSRAHQNLAQMIEEFRKN